jgi:hypothetical protein
MAEIWKPLDIQVYKDWVSAILTEASDSLSDWESGFVDSIEGQLNRGRILSQKQAEILERIYSEKTK